MVADRGPVEDGQLMYPVYGSAPDHVPYGPRPEFESEEQLTAEIALTGIKKARVAQAFIESVQKRRALQVEAGDIELEPDELQVPSVTAIDRHLKALRRELKAQGVPEVEWPEVRLDDHPLEGMPDLPGYKPLAGVISTESIAELDDHYGAGFTRDSLRDLLDKRDEEAERKAAARSIAGPAAVAASVETSYSAERDPLEDNPENEFNFRLRAGQLYVGDIPFMHWYVLLHSAAVRFMQQQRQEGWIDLPDVRLMKDDKIDQLIQYVDYLADNPAVPPLIMQTRTFLPDMSSDDTDIDTVTINKLFHDLGYPAGQDFVYEALHPALVRAPHVRGVGPLRRREKAPEPEMPEDQRRRVAAWVRLAPPVSSSPNALSDDAYDGAIALDDQEPYGGEDQADEAYEARGSIVPGYDGQSDPGEGAAEQPKLKPSDHTLARLRHMNHYMKYETEGMRGMLEWTGMCFWTRPLTVSLFVLQRIVRR